jgi:hypothetical protein
MSTSVATSIDRAPGRAQVIAGSVAWPLYAVLFASTSVIVGVMWDISWHRTIGRDTFWTPAHLAIYLGGIVAGLTCGYLALRTTFGGDQMARDESVRFWGFRAPLGAWVCIWGALAMLTSAPFDDWWHNTYGLDVKILSPPHVVLAIGIGAIQCGAMLMALAHQNRALVGRTSLGLLYVYAAGLLLLMAATMCLEYTSRWELHQAMFYMVSCGVFPFFLVSTARASTLAWPATGAAAVYTLVTLVMMWILPQFEGRPLLGPIFVQVDRFMPTDFPLLLVFPAIAIDLLMRRTGNTRDWRLSIALAAAFLTILLAVTWPFADFLMSPWARNGFFMVDRMPYSASPAFQARWYRLNPPDNLAAGLPIALALAFVSVRFGLWWGNWMARVQR